jgi:hypothetical protein
MSVCPSALSKRVEARSVYNMMCEMEHSDANVTASDNSIAYTYILQTMEAIYGDRSLRGRTTVRVKKCDSKTQQIKFVLSHHV